MKTIIILLLGLFLWAALVLIATSYKVGTTSWLEGYSHGLEQCMGIYEWPKYRN